MWALASLVSLGTLVGALGGALGACGKSKTDKGGSEQGGSPGSAAMPAPAASGSGGSSSFATAAAADSDALGALHFEISGGTPEARQLFRRGLLALHSFWYDEAQKQFDAAIAADPSFSMAYWGLAMSHAKLLWGDDNLDAGRAALTRMPSPQALPPHDQAWVMAALSLFRRASADVRASRRAFLAIMEQLHAKFPDEESATFLALALLATVQPGDPSEVELRKRAAQLATEVFQRNPKHPGAAHYIIHAYDTPSLASLALPAARQYATIAPAAFHALHMPAHIFVRLGMWKEAAVSCQAAWDSSIAWVQRDKLAADHEDFHSLSWLAEIGFERGRRKDAERALATYADAVRGGLSHDKRAAYANQVGSFLGRTGEWARADELLEPLKAPASDAGARSRPGSSGACGSGAPLASGAPNDLFERRALLGTLAQAAAHRKDLAGLERMLAQRDAVDAELRPFLAATQPKELLDATDKLRGFVRKALVARAKGDDRALIEALRPLAEDQDQEFTGEGIAGGILHHEDIAEALLRLGKAREALAEYRVVLAVHPGRARSLLGAARIAKSVEPGAARELHARLAAIWSDAEAGTDGLDEVRRAAAPP